MNSYIKRYINNEIHPFTKSKDFKDLVLKGEDEIGETMACLDDLLVALSMADNRSNISFKKEEFEKFSAAIVKLDLIIRKTFKYPGDDNCSFTSTNLLKGLRLVDIVKIRECVIAFQEEASINHIYGKKLNTQILNTSIGGQREALKNFVCSGNMFAGPFPLEHLIGEKMRDKLKGGVDNISELDLYERPFILLTTEDYKPLVDILDDRKSGSAEDLSATMKKISAISPEMLERMRNTAGFAKVRDSMRM